MERMPMETTMQQHKASLLKPNRWSILKQYRHIELAENKNQDHFNHQETKNELFGYFSQWFRRQVATVGG